MNETNSIRERYQWKRVEAPKRWYPKEVGQSCRFLLGQDRS